MRSWKKPSLYDVVLSIILVMLFVILIYSISMMIKTAINDKSTEIGTNTAPVASSEVITITPVETEIVTVIETQIVTVPVSYLPDDYDYARALATLYELRDRAQYEHYLKVAEKWPIAAEVWTYLTEEMMLNNYVAAGIMGNLMNECGGNSLTLQPKVYGLNKGFYGICQWALVYNPQIKDATLIEQLDFLRDSIREAFDKYGYLYQKGFDYAQFCAMTDCRAAADAFRVVYERPGSSTAATRRNNACYAYSTFVYSE